MSLDNKTEILSKEGKQLHATLLQKYPKLFGRVLIDFNGVKRFIPQARLTEQSKKFSRMLSIGLQESKLREITFENKNYDKKTVSHFLQYLEIGKIELAGDNLLAFFCLADEHLLPELTELCSKFLAESLSVENFTSAWESGAKLNNPTIQWECLAFACKNIKSLENEFENKKLSDRTKGILELAKECSENNIAPLTEKGYRTIKLNSFEAANLATLEKLNKEIGITGLNISGDEVNSKVLEKTIEKIPVLNYLFIKNSKIESIPKKWLEKLEVIDCRLCTALTSLTAPMAKEIDCSSCHALTSLSAAKAEKITCIGCESLTSLTAPMAKEITCSGCTALPSLSAPKAKKINCSGCTALPSLSAPKAKKIDFRGCKSLTSLTAPMAKKIDCDGCKSLTSLTASMAKEITCSGCKALISLTAPKAEKIDFRRCKSLTSLSAAKAEKIICFRCPELLSLTALMAKEIICFGCELLTSLTAPMAKEITCIGCESLTSLIAPKAKII